MFPYYLDQISFALGVLTGVTGTLTVIGFAVALVVFAGKDADKRGLSRRHSDRRRWHDELRSQPFSTLPAVAPQKDSAGPGSTTAAGRKAKRPPRHNFALTPPATSSRSRPESSSGVQPKS